MFVVRRRKKKLETRRRETLSAIRGQQLAFEAMVQRANIAGEASDNELVKDVLARIKGIEHQATEEQDFEELESLVRDAEQQGQLRAYICPAEEVSDEGKLSIDRLQEWDVPKAVVSDLRNTLGAKLNNADLNVARSALRAVFDEYDSWAKYTDDYDEKMESCTRRLFVGVIISLP